MTSIRRCHRGDTTKVLVSFMLHKKVKSLENEAVSLYSSLTPFNLVNGPGKVTSFFSSLQQISLMYQLNYIKYVLVCHLWRFLLAFCSTILCHTRTIFKKNTHQNISCFSYIGIDTLQCKDLVMVDVMHLNMRILMEPQSFPILAWELFFSHSAGFLCLCCLFERLK